MDQTTNTSRLLTMPLTIKRIADLTPEEKISVKAFFNKYSLLDNDYVEQELMRYRERDLIQLFNAKGQLLLVLSIDFKKKGCHSYIYFGDMLKADFQQKIPFIKIVTCYLIAKEGLLRLLLKPKSFISCCYNPRTFTMIASYLHRYSSYDCNIEHAKFKKAISIFQLNRNMQDGFYLDKAIKKAIPLGANRRYQTSNYAVNQYFQKHVFEGSPNTPLYKGKSLVFVACYNPLMMVTYLKSIVQSLFRHKGVSYEQHRFNT